VFADHFFPDIPADEIASLQRALDEGGTFLNKVSREAYERFQAVFPDNSDKVLQAWARLNMAECENSLAQRANSFRKQREQFQALVRIPSFAFRLCHVLNTSSGKTMFRPLWF
jgi:uncharacterized protein YmfQ (DUF2313 family)